MPHRVYKGNLKQKSKDHLSELLKNYTTLDPIKVTNKSWKDNSSNLANIASKINTLSNLM